MFNQFFLIISRNVAILNLLITGHKLGDPSPLFGKIEVEKIEELKKKFAGKQSERLTTAAENNITSGDVTTLEEEVAKQVICELLLKI